MLSELVIRNIAVISSASIAFSHGFCVFTGETGAGKSILIGALGAVLGERTSKDLIRTGEGKAFVSASFSNLSPETCEKIAQLGYDAEGGEVLLTREFSADHNVCRINGMPATVGMLRAVGSLLIVTHGQQDNQLLASVDKHLEFVDAFSQLGDLLEEYRESYRNLTQCRARLAGLQQSESDKARKIDLLSYQIDEIDAANLTIGEEEELTARRKVIQNSASLTEMLTRCRENLTGTDALDGVIALLDDTAGALEAAGRTLETLAPLSARVMDYRYELDEIANLVREGLDELEYDPRELDEIEERLDAIRRLKKKYGFSIEEILKFRDSAKAELDLMVQSEEKIKELSVLCEKAQAQAQSLAARLGEGRKKGAARLIEAVKRELIALDMPKVQMDIAFYVHPLSENGAESLEFLLSVNPGETPRPLAKIASGGEMSRIMLAIKSVISAKDDIATLIFDEIDAGISGRAAQKVGAKLRALSSERQVICVTHLAQVAAFADHHLLIEKQVYDQRTFTQVRTLDREGRLRELARIASGDQTTDIALKNAAQMLDMAQDKRA